ncbi:McrB family protein [Sporolactobacillus inulinus]|uniref:McrB family protein n=1 Tax=Sporolactobacillus inulinus TaxID=2078 RepID=UPI00116C372A|nr:hypothetical protein [Sporolactobacillus inulinus]GEB77773.1 hypothetical protein SIN01_21180 [Sporolactobacillus inulinus]
MSIQDYDHTLGNYYLARLATADELGGYNRRPVFDEFGQGPIKVMLRVMSTISNDVKLKLMDNDITQALAYRLQKDDSNIALISDNKIKPIEKIKRLKEYLSNAVIVFRLEQKNGYLNPAIGAQIKTAADTNDLWKKYDTIPYFNVDDKDLLIRSLVNKEPINDYRYLLVNRNFDALLFEDNFCPPYILIHEKDQVFAYGPLRNLRKNETLILDFSDHAFLIPLGQQDDFLLKQYNNLSDLAEYDDFNTTCYFIDSSTSQKIKEQLTAHEEVSSAEATSETHEDEKGTGSEWTHLQKEKLLEKQLIEAFEKTAQNKGLYYDRADFFNFHAAIKTGNLVILAGMSGTGKSKIVDCYAEALGLNPDDNYLKISVRPFWQDDSDLLGYLDVLNNVYRPGESAFVDFLARAEDHPDQLFLVCFDEMNLARVEHYFSQFLSVLEQDAGNRKINLYNEDFEGRLYNSEKYKATVKIYDNVLFVGTVNLDESTYHFSDKVLDRANVIQLKLRNFADIYDEERTYTKTEIIQPVRMSTESFLYGTEENQSSGKGLKRRELEMLWDIHCAINKCNDGLGVGLRIVNQINKYLICLPDYGPIDRQTALDFQIVQRILSKVRGSEEQLKTLVGDGQEKSGELFTIIDQYQDLSSFKKTRNRIQSIAREIEVFGYTL